MNARRTIPLLLAVLLPAASAAAQDRTATTTRSTSTTTAAVSDAQKMFLSGMRGAQAAPALQSTYSLSARQIPAVMGQAGYPTPAIVEGLVTGIRTAPAEATQWLMEEKKPVGEIAVGLRNTGLQDVEVLTALRGGGFDAAAATTAAHGDLRIVEAAVGKALADAGYGVAETRTALRSAGVASDPVLQGPEACLTWEGQTVCPGGSSGITWPQAMGAVNWDPQGQGETGATLTLESTNIPPVEVRIGSIPLTLIEATSTRIRARLPSSPVTGDLVMVRVIDGAAGTIEPGYRVVEPPLEWKEWSEPATEAALTEIRLWITGAEFLESRCTVAGVAAIGTPGVLSSSYGFGSLVRGALLAAGAPSEVAAGWQSGFEAAWLEWAGGVIVPSLPWYPGFAAWPGAFAPPTPGGPTPLALLVSDGLPAMSQPGIAERIATAIGTGTDEAAAEAAIGTFAGELAGRFLVWMALTQVVNVMGSGPVPSHDPPKVPAGPVVGGSCSGMGVLAGPPF